MGNCSSSNRPVDEQPLRPTSRENQLSGPTSGQNQPLSLVLLGQNRAGKSSVGNAIFGRRAFRIWRLFTKSCVKKTGEVNGRSVTVVHTPGWTGFTHTTSKYDKGEIKKSIYYCLKGLIGFVLVVNTDSEFKGEQMNSAEEHMELIGRSVWNHTVLLLITRGEQEDSQTQHINQDAIEWFKKKCGDSMKYLVFNKNKKTGAAQVMKDLLETAESVAMQYDGKQNPMNGQQEEHKREIQQLVEELKKLAQKGKGKIKECSSSEAGNPHTAGTHEDLYNQICAAETEEEEMTIFYRALSSGSKEFFKLLQKNKPDLFQKLGSQFVEEHRVKLIQRATAAQSIADALHGKKMIHSELYSQIRAAVTSHEKMRLLYRALETAAKIRATFFKLLLENESYLLEDLAQTQLEEE